MQTAQSTMRVAPAQAGLTVRPMARTIGAEVSGIDLRQPLTDGQRDGVYQALLDWKVIFFRDQDITREQHLAFARQFGGLEVHPFAPAHDGPPEVLPIAHTPENPGRENLWHSDVTWRLEPSLGSVLRCIKGPQMGGDTLFADMYAAYDALSDRMKTYLDGLTALHDGARIFGPGTPAASHPVIVRHPESGKKLIYVNDAFTAKINDVPPEESDAILRFLYAHCAWPEWSFRFRWRPHSIAFWDNRCAHHYAVPDYWPAVRSGYRVQIDGVVAPVAG